jgi:hypothetical protein
MKSTRRQSRSVRTIMRQVLSLYSVRDKPLLSELHDVPHLRVSRNGRPEDDTGMTSSTQRSYITVDDAN